MKIGKLTSEQLARIFPSTNTLRNEVVLRPKAGEGFAALDFEGDLLVLSSASAASSGSDAGRSAVHGCLNELASQGAQPVGILASLLVPVQASEQEMKLALEQIKDAAEQMSIEWIGAQIEVTDAVCRMVIQVTAVGRCQEKDLIAHQKVHAGEDLVLTKYAGMEGTLVICTDFEQRAIRILGAEAARVAESLSGQLNCVKEGTICAQCGASAIYNVTKGGVLGAVYELVEDHGLGVWIDEQAVPVLESTKKLCSYMGLDPLRLTSAGCLLAVTPNGEETVKKLEESGIHAAVIGRIQEYGFGRKIDCIDGCQRTIGEPRSDEIFKLYAEKA